MKKPELLAPAGSMEMLSAVIRAGADAVYFGGPAFGARAYAGNFSIDEGVGAVRLLHLLGKKAYLTVNTLLKNRELRDLLPMISPFYEAGIDGVLVQDMGVLSLLHKACPDLPLHASTQMSVASAEGALFLSRFGVERIVLARELSLKEIKEIHEETDLELEVFLHGALCVSYSGQCLMSSMIGGRSGNRGRCAQPCRKEYTALSKEGRGLPTPGKFLISPKDLMGLYDIPALIRAGVDSLKIEGRMKSPSYAYHVTRVYREAIDRALSKEDPDQDFLKREEKALLRAGNRGGFTDLYFHKKNGPEMMSFADSSFHADLKEDLSFPGVKAPIRGRFRARPGEEMALAVSSASDREKLFIVHGPVPDQARSRATGEEEVRKKLQSTGNTPFTFKDLTIDLAPGLFIPHSVLKEMRRKALDGLLLRLAPGRPRRPVPEPLFSERRDLKDAGRENVDRPLRGTFFSFQEAGQLNYFLKQEVPFSGLILSHRIWAFPEETAQADLVLALKTAASNEGIPGDLMPLSKKMEGKRLVLALPPVIREDRVKDLSDQILKAGGEGEVFFLAESLDGLGLLRDLRVPEERVLIGERVYTFNDEAGDFFKREGYIGDIIPLELSSKELLHRRNQRSLLLVYGRIPVMTTQNCTHKNLYACDKREEVLSLKDERGIAFPVANDCTVCLNTVYNSYPYSILKDRAEIASLDPSGIIISFTIEDERKEGEVLSHLRDGLFPFETTRGHFHRGVE